MTVPGPHSGKYRLLQQALCRPYSGGASPRQPAHQLTRARLSLTGDPHQQPLHKARGSPTKATAACLGPMTPNMPQMRPARSYGLGVQPKP